MASNEFDDRKRLTFEQAEGEEPIAKQLQLREISQELRALLWHLIHQSLERTKNFDGFETAVGEPWRSILYAKHIARDHKMSDDFADDFRSVVRNLKSTFVNGSYVQVFGLVQWLLRHPKCPLKRSDVADALELSGAAYRLLDGQTIVPFSSEQEMVAIKHAFADVRASEFKGAREHIRLAAEALTQGSWASCIRESVHAVESVARTLEPSGELSAALSKLEASARLHPAMKKGMLAIYGFSSDEKGIRHPLLDDPAAKVDEADALFMLGACASFVSYLINRARIAGLLSAKT